ncbi:hypothetical protein QR680_004401 [Steinernema hermaphroditum]|uniref:Uncharacterized protein n=1 Tax=Steinernema hermaphroditum TaxID=289476 RepID=A0AA39LTL8_9BILA|nr:hypothetical protein QR680_004401 [Steinernema hermaphroditum]
MSYYNGQDALNAGANEANAQMTEEEYLRQMEEYNASYAAIQQASKPKYSSLSLALAQQSASSSKRSESLEEKGEEKAKKERKRERRKSSSSSDDHKHKKRKKDKKKKHKKEKRRERSPSEERKPSISGFLCNNEKWSFYKPMLHIDSRDLIVLCTKADRDNLYYGKFTKQEQAKYRFTVRNDILGGDYELRRVFGMTDASAPAEPSKVKPKAQKTKILFGPLQAEPEQLDSYVGLSDAQAKGMVEETDPLEQELQKLRVTRREQPRNKEVYKEIIDLEDKLADKRALFCSKKEREDVMTTHKDRMLDLWKDYAVNFSKDAAAVTGYLNLLVDKETSNAPELKKEITQFINTRKMFFKYNVDFWRFIVEKIYAKQSRSVLDYIQAIDTVISDFSSSRENEGFLAELILLRTRVLFESGHIPTAVATLQISLWTVSAICLLHFGIQAIRECAMPIATRSKEYKKSGGDISQMADEKAANRFIEGLKELIFQSTESLVRALPKESSEADLWLGMEASRQRHLWSPLANYADKKLKGVLESAEVPFKRIESVVLPFKNISVVKKLILDVLAMFGVPTFAASTNEDNILRQFAVFEHPAMNSELENFAEWLDSVLQTLSKTGEGSDAYRYALAALKLSKMTRPEQFKDFIKSEHEIVGADVIGCATVDQVLCDVEHTGEHEKLDMAYLKLTHLLETVGCFPECFDQSRKPMSIYAFRTYARLLTVCPDNDQPYKKLSMSRQHLYRKILGKQIVKEIEVACKQGSGFFAETSRILSEIFSRSLKLPASNHVLGEPTAYIGFFLAVITYVRTKSHSFEAFIDYIEQLKLNNPELFETELMDELVVQFLWKRSEVSTDRSLHSKIWKLNKAALDRYPTNAMLMKLLVSNGFVDGNSFALRCKFNCSDKNPFVNVVRACASIYFSVLRVKRQGSDFTQNQLETELTRGTLRKAITNFALCSHSSVFVRVWLRYETHFGDGKTVSMKTFASDALAIPFSKHVLTDYARLDRQLYDDVVKLIFSERSMLGYTHSAEAAALLQKCRGQESHEWSWPIPFARRFLTKKRFVETDMSIVIPLVSVTVFWLLIGAVGPLLVPSGPNRGIIQTMIVMTAVCCHLFWILVYLHQLNPLIGPQIPVRTIRWISEQWGDANELVSK